MSEALRWVFYSRQRLYLTVGAVLALVLLLFVIRHTGGSEPAQATAKPKATASPTGSPGSWLVPTETATPTPSASETVKADPVREQAAAFVEVFTDRSLAAGAWREELTRLATPELAEGLSVADPARVPVYVGEPDLDVVAQAQSSAEVRARYEGSGLRVLLAFDGETWLVSNILPLG